MRKISCANFLRWNMKGSSGLFGKAKRPKLPKGISRSQKNRIEKGYRKIDDHLTIKDIEGAVRDIKKEPILDKNGRPYQHYKEVDDAVRGLKKERDSLTKSIKNPNLTPEVKKSIRDAINEFDIKINEWERIKRGN